jgi:hypothetical protein
MENCAGNYAAQLFTVELNHRGQMNFVLDVWEQYARTCSPASTSARFVSVLCNHGEFGRMGAAKNQTSDSDNAGGFLAETLRRVLDRPEFAHVEWTIPHDEMNVYADVAGVPMAFNHGHKIPGNDATRVREVAQRSGPRRRERARCTHLADRTPPPLRRLGHGLMLSVPGAQSLDGGSQVADGHDRPLLALRHPRLPRGRTCAARLVRHGVPVTP